MRRKLQRLQAAPPWGMGPGPQGVWVVSPPPLSPGAVVQGRQMSIPWCPQRSWEPLGASGVWKMGPNTGFFAQDVP